MKRTADQGGVSPEFVAALFQAAVEEDGFQALSQLIADEVGVTSCTMWTIEAGNISEASSTPDLLDTIPAYVGHFSRLDPWQNSIRRNPGRVQIGSEITDSELRKTEFYNDFARPLGVVRPMGALLPLTPSLAVSVGVQQRGLPARVFKEGDQPRLGRLLPYIGQAMQLRQRMRQQARAAMIRGAALEAVDFGLIVCSGDGNVALSNAAAECLVRQRTGLLLGPRGSGVGAIVQRESRMLKQLIHETAAGGPGGLIRLTAQDGANGVLVLATPLPRGFHPDLGEGHTLLALRATSESFPFTEGMLAALFGLSPAQASIAIAVVNGQTPDVIAAERQVKISTVRTHLSEIFLRTGTESQLELVRLLARLPPVRRP